MTSNLPVILRCNKEFIPKIRYVFDTLFLSQAIKINYLDEPPSEGVWLLYGSTSNFSLPLERCLAIAHSPEIWQFFKCSSDIEESFSYDDLNIVFPTVDENLFVASKIKFDLIANAFYFLSSWSERLNSSNKQSRFLYSNSVFSRHDIQQDIVDQYLKRLIDLLNRLCDKLNQKYFEPLKWPKDMDYALILSHDVDFIPSGPMDNLKQGVKTVLRHLFRQRDPFDALLAAKGLLIALSNKRDPYGCVPEIIQREKQLGTQASFQVAVGHRHPNDVNYFIENDPIRNYLSCIVENGFELCLHGSYRSTENLEWYLEETKLLTQRLGKPIGSRQHYLSFNYDNLFTAQEMAGIEYDMSMGFPDKTGPRSGFSYPYFPYCLKEDRPYRVLQLNLFLMDVTLRGYMGLKGEKAWEVIKTAIDDLRVKRGCASVVWHPIVFGGARDPGYDKLFWRLIAYAHENGGLTTDGRTINNFWRNLAKNYTSFS